MALCGAGHSTQAQQHLLSLQPYVAAPEFDPASGTARTNIAVSRLGVTLCGCPVLFAVGGLTCACQRGGSDAAL
jgi:hypothetical protein